MRNNQNTPQPKLKPSVTCIKKIFILFNFLFCFISKEFNALTTLEQSFPSRGNLAIQIRSLNINNFQYLSLYYQEFYIETATFKRKWLF